MSVGGGGKANFFFFRGRNSHQVCTSKFVNHIRLFKRTFAALPSKTRKAENSYTLVGSDAVRELTS